MTLHDLLQQARREAFQVAADRDAFRRRQYLRQHLPLIQLSAMGVPRKQMAQELGVSPRTIEQRFTRLCELLACTSVAHLVGRAFMLGLLEIRDNKIFTNPLAIEHEF